MVQTIVGRDTELARIDAFLADGGGRSVLLIDGEPGMGKTTLWQAAIDRASDRSRRVLQTQPTDAEATFSYSGLGDLFESIDDDLLVDLPTPQRRALRVALLREEPEGQVPEVHVIGVAVLNALRGLARAGPVLVAVDDVQWLDSSSALAIGFAIRRLQDSSIQFLLAQRADAQVGTALGLEWVRHENVYEHIAVGSLRLEEMRRLLQSRLGSSFPRPTLRRIYATSGGNPMFGLELGRAIQERQGRLEAGDDLPISDDLMALIGARITSLPRVTQDLLAVAAILAAPTLAVIAQVIDRPSEDALDPAIEAKVVVLEQDRIRFIHPLGAAATRRGIPPTRRRDIHARLAQVVADPEERARHLALAAEGPDEVVASALEAAAKRARARGAPDAAIELAALAIHMTPEDLPTEVARRKLAEASYASAAGDFRRARAIAEDVLESGPPPEIRRQALAKLAFYHMVGVDCRAGVALFRLAIEEAGDNDRLRMRCEAELTGGLDLLGEDFQEALRHGYLELGLAERLGDQVHIATALRGIARNEQRLSGRLPTELIERSLTLEPSVSEALPVNNWPSYCFAEMLCWTDDLTRGLARWEWLLDHARDRGALYSSFDMLAHMVPYECAAGLWSQALVRAEEGYELAREAGSVVFQATLAADRALVEAHMGDEAATRRHAAEAIDLGRPSGALLAERTAAWALGILELSLGDPSRANDHLGPLVESRKSAGVAEPGDMRFVPGQIEALIGTGRLVDAQGMLDWYDGLARASGRIHAQAACHRGRGLLLAARGDLDAALEALEASRTRYATIADPFGLGRTLLALGTIERRALHRRAARASLGASLEVFNGLGAKLWADTARTELARIGGRHAAGDELTPGERQVAALVAEGHTNREVAAALVLTERTIEGHLSSIYAKLQIRSRAELARRLASGSQPPA
jgi:DNA-binding CsgD family transcriptional regulator